MNPNSNIKSLTLGMIIGAAVVMTIGAVVPRNDPPGPVGRFQISVGGGDRAFVMDTATGQVWQSHDRNFHGPKLPAEDKSIQIVSQLGLLLMMVVA